MFRDHKVYQPHPALKELVNNIVIQKVELDRTLSLPVFPMPPIQEQAIFFYPNDPVHIKSPSSGQTIQLPRSTVVARRIKQIDVEMGYNHLVVKVGLQPGALFRLSGVPLQELGADEIINETEYLLDKQISFITEQLNEAPSFEDMVNIIQKWLFTRTQKLKARLPIDKILPELLQKQTPGNISEIASLSCVSIRHLERLYRQRIGLSPKFYARLVRFTKAWITKEANPRLSWTKLAYSCGYFDQMHLIRDFKQFGGASPSIIQRKLQDLPVSLQHEVFH